MCLLTAGPASADELPLVTAVGRVVKANPNVILVRPVEPGGQLGKAIALKVRGTSRVSTVAVQRRRGQTVTVQRQVEPQSLRPDQVIAVIYTRTTDEAVLLSAVVLPPEKP
jgi:hypothetical protein